MIVQEVKRHCSLPRYMSFSTSPRGWTVHLYHSRTDIIMFEPDKHKKAFYILLFSDGSVGLVYREWLTQTTNVSILWKWWILNKINLNYSRSPYHFCTHFDLCCFAYTVLKMINLVLIWLMKSYLKHVHKKMTINLVKETLIQNSNKGAFINHMTGPMGGWVNHNQKSVIPFTL